MRWQVEVSSVGKTDLQKFVVEAESWQRALQAARAQRGEEGPMSGFSIELLEEGYRAVDPVARVRFVVKRASDDTPITAPLAKDAAVKGGVAPSPPSVAPPASIPKAPSSGKSVPPRPGNAGESKKSSIVPPAESSKSAAPPAPIGSAVPGLPPVKVLSSREQNPTEASPLTYREYSFAVPAGTPEDVAVNVLKAQLKLVDAHLAEANVKMGKLVNLAVFDVEFTGKPPSPPVATLTWKDWKGEPVVGYPRRGPAQKQVKPPSVAPPDPPPSPPATDNGPSSLFPPMSIPRPVASPPSAAGPAAPPVTIPQAPAVPSIAAVAPVQVVQPSFPAPPSSTAAVPSAPASPVAAEPKAAHPFSGTAPMIAQELLPASTQSVPPPPAMFPPAGPAPVSASGIPAPVVAPVGVFQPTHSSPPPGMPTGGSVPPPAIQHASQPPRTPSVSPDGMVRTPSGRFVRGRTTGDELITALFESMHDLHFLRDALDGGQFCLALATEVLPARAALIHFFDVEKRQWVVACTRGKDTNKVLTLRTPESDDLLRDAARKRRAVVLANASTASAERYQTLGGSRSMIIAPIMQAGRALGAIEIINPLDGMPFSEDEGNAMTYIAEQYAEYLGSRGIVLDRERIQAAATPRA